MKDHQQVVKSPKRAGTGTSPLSGPQGIGFFKCGATLGLLVSDTLMKVASSNPRADNVQICRSAPEQAVNPLFLGRH